MANLTRRQKQLLDFILATRKEQGVSPSLREIMDELSIASTNHAREMLQTLSKKGAVRIIPNVARGIVPLDGAQLAIAGTGTAGADEQADPGTQYTPDFAVWQLLQIAPPKPTPLLVCEPACGRGHIVAELAHYMPRGNFVGIDLRSGDIGVDNMQLALDIEGRGGRYDFELGCNALREQRSWWNHSRASGTERFDQRAVITNPDFGVAFDYLQRAVNEAHYVALLLRAGFWEKLDRAEWYYANPADCTILIRPRPFASHWAHCWYVWGTARKGYHVGHYERAYKLAAQHGRTLKRSHR